MTTTMTFALKPPELTRRSMLAGIGGMTFFFAFGTDGTRILPPTDAATRPAPLSPWVRILPDGNITILTITEMGQGSGTSIPLMIAEEMDADWNKVTLDWAPSTPEVYGWPDRSGRRVMTVTGSRAVMMYWNDLRTAGAQVRKVLIANAAEHWGVDAATLKTEPSAVVDPKSGKRLSYGEIAAFGQVPATLPAVDKSELKSRKDFRLIGRSVPRRDLPFKVNGSAQYSIDVKLPGMVYASALHAPVSGNAPEKWNDAAIKAMPGVLATVKLPHGVGIVAESFPQAMAARRALRVTWSRNKVDGFDSEKALDHYAAIHADTSAPVKIVDAKGDIKAAFDGAAKVYKAEYRSDYTYHAQMEPLNAVARFNDAGDRLEVWDGSQDLGRSRDLVARTLSMKPEQVDVHQCYLGGGFGRRSLADYAAEAAVLAREVKRPVKLVWTREEDVAHGMFRPMTFQCLEAATDASGKVVGWRHCAIGDDGGLSLITGGMRISSYYGLPNQQLELRNVDEGVRIKHWRAVAHNFNLFAIETMVDALADDQKLDPVEFRLQRMSITPKARRCVEAVTKMADWGTMRPDDRALGFAMSERSGSLGACVVEASIDRRAGTIRVHKVWVAADGGVIVQPEAAKANVESGIVYGLSSALHERLTVRDGAVEQSNFGDYSVMRMSDMPEVMQVSFLDSDGHPTGLGEISTPGMAPAIANAFHKLTGKRLYHMPFTPERVLAALKA
ncbi:MAG TPA: molybdopterin cofactor-binding domain-containing protein [Pseudolabrys sp.]|nr:molybdopterin cofactor-binding domain-containing protein [Pseudolabrys sp.]